MDPGMAPGARRDRLDVRGAGHMELGMIRGSSSLQNALFSDRSSGVSMQSIIDNS